jgi:hypothetical protein
LKSENGAVVVLSTASSVRLESLVVRVAVEEVLVKVRKKGREEKDVSEMADDGTSMRGATHRKTGNEVVLEGLDEVGSGLVGGSEKTGRDAGLEALVELACDTNRMSVGTTRLVRGRRRHTADLANVAGHENVLKGVREESGSGKLSSGETGDEVLDLVSRGAPVPVVGEALAEGRRGDQPLLEERKERNRKIR